MPWLITTHMHQGTLSSGGDTQELSGVSAYAHSDGIRHQPLGLVHGHAYLSAT